MIDMTNYFSKSQEFELELLRHIKHIEEGETISILPQSFLIPDIFRIARHFMTRKGIAIEIFFKTIDGQSVVKITRVPAIDIQREISNLQIGESHTFKAPSATQKRSIRNYAQKWTKMDAECTFSCEQKGEDMVVSRIEGKDIGPGRKSAYPEIDALEIGESYTFELPRVEHHRIRLACKERNKTLDVGYTCNIVPGGIRVTRIPATYEERFAYSETFKMPHRHSKWGLERLENEKTIEFSGLESSDYGTLRSSCSQKANTTGWKIKCSIDRATGTATVTRCG